MTDPADLPPRWPASIMTYRDAFLHVMTSDPDRVVIFDLDRPVTAQGFLDRVGIMALWLEDNAPQRDEAPLRVGVALHDNIWSMAALIACWFVRLTPFLLDHRHSPDDLRLSIRRNDLRLVVTRQNRLIGAADEVVKLEDPVQLLTDPQRVALGGALLARVGQTPADPCEQADFLASSGVSGSPKIHPLTQQQVLWLAGNAATDGHRGKWGAALSAVSVVFGAARLIWWRNLLYGRPIHALRLLFGIAELDAALRDDRIEECGLPPHIIRALVRHAADHPGPVPRYPHLVKLQSIGGPALATDKLAAQAVLSPHYVMTYSSTETGVVARIEGEDLRRRPESCGKLLAPHQVDIVDEAGHPVPVGTVGRIRVMQQRHVDGEMRDVAAWPGDLGWIDHERFLFIAARGDGIICRNGVNYASSVLEARLLDCADVLDVAVLRIPHKVGDDDMLIAISLSRSEENRPDPTQVARALRRRLSSHQQPCAIVLVGDFFVTAGGKIQRNAVLETYLASPSTMVLI